MELVSHLPSGLCTRGSAKLFLVDEEARRQTHVRVFLLLCVVDLKILIGPTLKDGFVDFFLAGGR